MKHLYKTTLITLLFATFNAVAAESAKEPVKFSDALYPKFQHERCMNCHQFNSRRSNGRSYNSHRNRYLCDKCHNDRVTGLTAGEWMAPPGSRMDYTGMTPRDACLLIKSNSASTNREAQLLDHLVNDARIHWALEGGMTPMGQFPTVPGGYKAWLKDVEAWARDGMLCE